MKNAITDRFREHIISMPLPDNFFVADKNTEPELYVSDPIGTLNLKNSCVCKYKTSRASFSHHNWLK